MVFDAKFKAKPGKSKFFRDVAMALQQSPIDGFQHEAGLYLGVQITRPGLGVILKDRQVAKGEVGVTGIEYYVDFDQKFQSFVTRTVAIDGDVFTAFSDQLREFLGDSK